MIDIGLVTTGSIDGTGNFDKLMQVAKVHLLNEYTSGRINGDKYADAYIAIMNNVMNQAIGFTIQSQQVNKQMELTEEQRQLILQQIKSEKAKIEDVVDGVPVAGSIGKQKTVHAAQAKGFHNNALQSAAKLMTDVWSVQRSTDEGISPNPQNMLTDVNIGQAVGAMFENLDINAGVSGGPSVRMVITGNKAAVFGNAGGVQPTSGAFIVHTIEDITIYDEDGTATPVVGTPTDGSGNFGADDTDISLLSAGTLTVQIKVKNAHNIYMYANAEAVKK